MSENNVGAIVLAAGMSSRMGRSKPLLPWADGKSVIEHILQQLQQVRLARITVVTGYRAEDVSAQAQAMGVQTTHNPNYAEGEMLSSLQAGLAAQPDGIAAALVVLGDQPRLEVSVIERILSAYEQGRGEIVAPYFQGQRGHPLLISRRYWDEMMALPPGAAPRDVIQKHRQVLHLIDVESDSVLSDIDTAEDYARERRLAGLSPN
jgi:molybdenum cofactor cytidylyltransferase